MKISPQKRLRITVQGAVQGVGFRPFIYRLATEIGLAGWINNTDQGVSIEIEGTPSQLLVFLQRIAPEKPPQARIHDLTTSYLTPVGDRGFEIRPSIRGEKTTLILPDLSICSDCLREMFDQGDRRYRYPFINCTNCGPRFSLIEALPYDRSHTAMRHFNLCKDCQAEYDNPLNRRFHAQPNACPRCGPQLAFWNTAGQVLAYGDSALQMAATLIRQGQVVALKGLGGFHLVVDAGNEVAVHRLRKVKHRVAKPFALMYPSLERVKADCLVSALEERLLQSTVAPIVLLERVTRLESNSQIAVSVAPNNPYLGIMLPYTPLHHLLLAELGFPVVATSGNRTDEPICIDEQDAMQRLRGIADGFLVHDRPIVHPVDDSVVRVMAGREMILRCGRGYAPCSLPIQRWKLESKYPSVSILAVGAQMKNTIAFSIHQQIFVSQHLGDLHTALTFAGFQQAISRFQQLYEFQPAVIACDLHPDYRSTHYAQAFAQQWGVPVIPVQHHYAHVLACMAEHQLEGTALGIAWDGTGYGLDGTIWGGEFLQITEIGFRRVAHFRTFELLGGEKAVRQPRRSAVGLLYAGLGDYLFELETLPTLQTFSISERQILQRMLHHQLNTYTTSSVGRLFDAIASVLGLCQYAQYEGQGAMELEFAIGTVQTDETYPFEIRKTSTFESDAMVIDWNAMLQEILLDRAAGLAVGQQAAKFHNTLIEIVIAIAQQVGEHRVILTGGCFQNRYLTERAIQRLRAEGFCPYWHERIPPNDGGIALGQIRAAFRERIGADLEGKDRCV